MKRTFLFGGLLTALLGCHVAPEATGTGGAGVGGGGGASGTAGSGGPSGTGGSGGGGSGEAKLPFAVDSIYAASGYMGDGEMPGGISDVAACPQRAGEALGLCHHLSWTPKSKGWAGIYWQYPAGNWGTSPGYPVEPGATQVSFWAWGEKGGEKVSFFAGIADADGFNSELTDVVLTTTPTQYFVNLRNETYSTVVGAFGWSSGTSDGVNPVVFNVDDIQWQKTEGVIVGCTDADATNYDATATMDDGSCKYDVTFQVDMTGVAMAPTDIVTLQSTFNVWCGDCNPLSDANGDAIWEGTFPLTVGTYEYKYTTNGWNGLVEDVPLACDVTGGQYKNRGFTLGPEPLVLPLHAFGVCPAP